MLNICSTNVQYQNAAADLCNISLIYNSAEKNLLRKLTTSTLPMYYMVLDFDYGI